MDSTDILDKIVINPTDSKPLAELFSRREPGDEVTGTFKGTLDEAGEKVIAISITELTINQGEGEEPIKSDLKDEGDEADHDAGKEPEEGEPGSTAAQIMKDDDGVPAQPGNDVPETFKP